MDRKRALLVRVKADVELALGGAVEVSALNYKVQALLVILAGPCKRATRAAATWERDSPQTLSGTSALTTFELLPYLGQEPATVGFALGGATQHTRTQYT